MANKNPDPGLIHWDANLAKHLQNQIEAELIKDWIRQVREDLARYEKEKNTRKIDPSIEDDSFSINK